MRIAIYTLGCKVNQYETQAMESELLRRGHTLVPFEEQADAYIVNTCAVTAMSGHKSRQIIRRAQKQNPRAVVGVCGCYSQTDPQAVAELGVDLVSGSSGRMGFLDDLERLASRKGAPGASGNRRPTIGVPGRHALLDFPCESRYNRQRSSEETGPMASQEARWPDKMAV